MGTTAWHVSRKRRDTWTDAILSRDNSRFGDVELIQTTQTWKIGDCLEIMQGFPDKHFDLILTDPPYGIGESNERNATRKCFAKTTDFGHYEWDKNRIGEEYFDEMMRVSKNQIIFGGNYYTDYLPPSACWIVWDKDNGANDFADCELAWGSFNTAVRIFRFRWQGMLQGNMKRKEKRVHPTQKPVPLFEWIIKKYSEEGDLICDPFLGGGTCLEACHRTDRSCFGIDINPQWEHLYPNRIKAHTQPLTNYFV